MTRQNLLSILAAAFSIVVLTHANAQAPENKYLFFQDALGLTDTQVKKCLEGPREDRRRILTAKQQEQLAGIIDRAFHGVPGEAALVYLLNLNEGLDWRLCLCACSSLDEAAGPLRFSSDQMALLEELQYAVNQRFREQLMAKQGQRDVSLGLRGAGDSSVVQLNAEIGELLNQLHRQRIRPEFVLMILNEKQRAIAEDLRREFELAREAVDLGLLNRQMSLGEGLCN